MGSYSNGVGGHVSVHTQRPKMFRRSVRTYFAVYGVGLALYKMKEKYGFQRTAQLWNAPGRA